MDITKNLAGELQLGHICGMRHLHHNSSANSTKSSSTNCMTSSSIAIASTHGNVIDIDTCSSCKDSTPLAMKAKSSAIPGNNSMSSSSLLGRKLLSDVCSELSLLPVVEQNGV